MSVRTYNPSVRVGNWNEDIQLEEDTLKDFLSRRERGELLTQKQANLKNSILKQVDLSIARDGKVKFGDKLMLVNPGTPDGGRVPSALSMNVTESCLSESSAVPVSINVVSSPNVEPSARNVFIITSMDGAPDGSNLKYGQPFYLCSAEGGLVLNSDRATFQKCAKKSRNNEVTLVAQPSHLTEWKVQPFDPQYRLELEWSDIRANQKIIFTHVKTNQCLRVEDQHLLRTPFGSEFEISSFTDLDSHKAEKDTNHWMLMMNVPGDSIMPVQPPAAD